MGGAPARGSRPGPSQTDDTVAAGEAPLSLGNRALGRLLQRRTATPERSDATSTFTYALKLYTVDEESYAEADAIARSLNAFSSSVFDEQTQTDFTVRFRVAVYAPPEPDILERAFGIRLTYRTGRKRVRRKRYREAADPRDEGARPSLMSYDWVNAHESEVVMPYPDDVEQLVYGDNPPASASVD